MIEVGEYVRTNDGRIFRVYKIDNKNPDYTLYSNEFTRPINYKIVKHSKNIIDLIEVGDYVNGKRIHKINKGSNYCYLYYGNCKTFIDYQIKTILTKEQYTQNCYKIDTN